MVTVSPDQEKLSVPAPGVREMAPSTEAVSIASENVIDRSAVVETPVAPSPGTVETMNGAVPSVVNVALNAAARATPMASVAAVVRSTE